MHVDCNYQVNAPREYVLQKAGISETMRKVKKRLNLYLLLSVGSIFSILTHIYPSRDVFGSLLHESIDGESLSFPILTNQRGDTAAKEISIPLLASPNKNITAAAQRIEECLEHRGTSGHWYEDHDFSRETFYVLDPRSKSFAKRYPNFQNGKRMAYTGNVYKWRGTSLLLGNGHENEIASQQEDGCQIQTVNYELFCKTMSSLKIRHILFVGDSLMKSQRSSLFRLIGIHNTKAKTIDCPNNNHAIHVVFYRQNLGTNLRKEQKRIHKKEIMQYGPEIAYCDGQPFKDNACAWHERYREIKNKKEGRALLILNQGAHFHSLETFASSLDQFVQSYNNISGSAGDIVVFRSTVPGHKNCYDTDQIPVARMTHDKFLERYATDQYDWNLFDSYNQYAKTTLTRDLHSNVTFHYLNVYNMTVLRPDQHVSSIDCLHYLGPGPMDFWNHLLITNLMDIVSLETMHKSNKEAY